MFKEWDGPVVQNPDDMFHLATAVQRLDSCNPPLDDLIIQSTSSSSETWIPLEDLSPLTSLDSSRCGSPTPQTKGAVGTLDAAAEIIQAATDSLKRKNAKNKNQSKANKKRKKEAARDSHFAIPAAKAKSREKYQRAIQPVHTSNRTKDRLSTQNAYIARKSQYDCNKLYTLEDLVGEKSRFQFRLEQWDGKTAKALIDKGGAMYGLLGGSPDDETWQETTKQAAASMEEARQRCTFSHDHHQRPRGSFPILRCGVSQGGGQVHPCNISHADTKKNRKVLNSLNRAACFRRISNFASSVFASWAPNLHRYYVDTAQALHGKYPDLERPFPQSAFSATTYNLGPQTICFPHTDLANLPYGWCAIVALGDYNPKKGGHLVLWECKIVVEFPPGSLILIPSAIIAHSNTPIQNHESRYSFTQYSAGGLFRWVEQEFKSQEKYRASKSEKELEEIDKHLRSRWEKGLALLPCLNITSSP